MELKVQRIAKKPTYTIGKLYIDGEKFCDTLEDRVRDLSKEPKIKGQTAIPAGRYRIYLTYSPRFKRILPLLEDVPQFTGVRIHRGNTAKDTEGCILVGFNREVGKVLDSAATEQRLMAVLQNAVNKGEQIFITIV